MEKYKLTAKTFAGLEEVLAEEIQNIGGADIKTGNRAVHYSGDLKLIYQSNYYLRTALRILKEISNFQFNNIDQFYLQCKRVEWIKFMNENQTFAIHSTVSNSREFKNSMFASLKVKDAIADYFRQKKGKRPDVDTINPDIIFNVYIFRNNCILSLDSSGESLHKRGYRVKQGDAPLNEVLAAGMILLTGWNGETDFVDPMCGSGTLPIEAAMIAMNEPPGKFRKEYSFINWPDFNMELFEEIKNKVRKKKFTNKIYASDISAESLLNAQTNARRALVFNKIQFNKSNFKDLPLSVTGATIIINPPYGERIKNTNMVELYSLIGERLKHQFTGNNAWILSSSVQYLKNIGLRPVKKMELFNGALRCQYLNYPLFSGKLNNYDKMR